MKGTDSTLVLDIKTILQQVIQLSLVNIDIYIIFD